MILPTIESQLRSYGEDLAARDGEGWLAAQPTPRPDTAHTRRTARLVLVAAMLVFVVGLGALAFRLTLGGEGAATESGPTSGPYLLPPVGSTGVQFGGDPFSSGSGISFVDTHGLQWSLYTYDQHLMGLSDEQFSRFTAVESLDAATSETIEPYGRVGFNCIDGVTEDPPGFRAGASWASDTTMSFVAGAGDAWDRPCSERIDDVRRMLGELQVVEQADWLAYNESVVRDR